MQRYSKAILFIVLTFVISWTYLQIAFQRGVTVVPNTEDPQAVITTFFVLAGLMLIPALTALLVQKVIYREPVIGPLGLRLRPNRWFLVAWVLPPLIALSAQAVALFMMPNVVYTPEMAGLLGRISPQVATPEFIKARDAILAIAPGLRMLIAFGAVLVFGVIPNAILALGEELGWRGFLQRELAPLGFWKYSFLIGIVWGLWHAPLVIRGLNYPQHPQLGVLMMVLFTTLLTPLLCYVRLRAKSVIASAILHGTLNASPLLATLFLYGGNDLTVGITGAAGLIILGGLNFCLFFLDPSLMGNTTVE